MPYRAYAILVVALSLFFGNLEVGGQTAGGNELYTTNQNLIQHFWNAVENSNGPVTVLAFGDSVSDSYRSIQDFMFFRLQQNLGWGGSTFGNFLNTTLWQLGNGTSIGPPGSNWWGIQGVIPPGGYVFWTNQDYGTGSLMCDKVGVFYVAQSGGGQFTMALSTNGGPWSTPVLSLDGYSSAPEGRYASVSLPRQPYRLRIDGLSGTNLVLGPRYVDSTSRGIDVAFMTQDGANLNQIFSLRTNILYPVLSALNPQLVVWHMKELADIGENDLSNRLGDLEALWKTCVTNGDIAYIGTPYDAHDLTEEFTPIQNQLVRQAAVQNGHIYLDCMTPCVSYQSMTNNGFLDDSVHPSNLCNQFLSDIVWQQLGLFTLRVDRRIQIEPSGTAVRLIWGTAKNLTYDLQSSTDLVKWSTFGSVIGDGLKATYTNSAPQDSTVFYRLHVRGN